MHKKHPFVLLTFSGQFVALLQKPAWSWINNAEVLLSLKEKEGETDQPEKKC